MEKAISKKIDSQPDTAPATTLRGKRLGMLTMELKPSLDAACAAIDAAPEFATDPDGHIGPRVLRKIAAYRAWLIGNGLPPRIYLARPWVKGVLDIVGHSDFAPTSAVKAAIAALADLIPAGCAAAAPANPDRIDLLAIDYAELMRDRHVGLPRNYFYKVNWPAAAEEMGCTPEELSTSVKGRLRVVDREINVPGPIVGRAARKTARHKANPAVGPLLAAELARRADGMPANPMRPGEIDVVDIAHGAGVSVRDLTETKDSPNHMAAMEAARGDKPLVPHPLLAARRFTYRELKEFGRKARRAEAMADGVENPADASRVTVQALTQFLTLADLGGRDTDLVPLDLPQRIRRAIAARPSGFISGWLAQIERWSRYFDEMRSTRPLPDNWTSALQILVAEAGITNNDLAAEVAPAVRHWINGLAFPTHQSESLVDELERVLRVTPGTLASRLAGEWRAQRPVVSLSALGRGGIGRTLPSGMALLTPEAQRQMIEDHWQTFRLQNTEFSRRLVEQIKAGYRLRFNQWPIVMQEAWKIQMPDETTTEVAMSISGRLPGQRPTKEERAAAEEGSKRGWRRKTAVLSQSFLESFFGYLVRSTTPPPENANARDTGFVDGPGLGMPKELVHPVLFAVVDLMAGYKHWRKDRSGGNYGPHIAYTMSQAAYYLKPNTGIVWKNPGYLEHLERFAAWWEESGAELGVGTLVLDLDAFREDWHAAIEECWELLIEDAAELKPNDPARPKIRNAFEVIEGYLGEADVDPMARYMVGVRQMLASEPLTALDRHRHRRNSILTLILVQTALRATTLLLTVSGPDPTLRREVEDGGAVRWRIVIPSARFKNFYSPYFAKGQPYEFTLDDEDGLYQLLDEYMAVSRPYLLAGRKSDALFISSGGKAYGAKDLSNLYRNMTSVFFVWNESTGTGIKGVKRHGLHAVRHIVATSLLRTTGDIYLAAWAIQDSARTVERHYGRFLPRDKVRLAVIHLRKSRAPVPAGSERRIASLALAA